MVEAVTEAAAVGVELFGGGGQMRGRSLLDTEGGRKVAQAQARFMASEVSERETLEAMPPPAQVYFRDPEPQAGGLAGEQFDSRRVGSE